MFVYAAAISRGSVLRNRTPRGGHLPRVLLFPCKLPLALLRPLAKRLGGASLPTGTPLRPQQNGGAEPVALDTATEFVQRTLGIPGRCANDSLPKPGH
jgi:hypothetical protein